MQITGFEGPREVYGEASQTKQFRITLRRYAVRMLIKLVYHDFPRVRAEFPIDAFWRSMALGGGDF